MKGNVGYRKTDLGNETPNILDKYVLKETRIAEIPLEEDITTEGLKTALGVNELVDELHNEAANRSKEDEKLENNFSNLKSDNDLLNQNFHTHKSDESNPHNVTKIQIGLGNVDDTSDADKPISTATQTALDVLERNIAKKASTIDLYGTDNLVHTFKSMFVDGDCVVDDIDGDGVLDIHIDVSADSGITLDGEIIPIKDATLTLKMSEIWSPYEGFVTCIFDILTHEIRWRIDNDSADVGLYDTSLVFSPFKIEYDYDGENLLSSDVAVYANITKEYQYAKNLTDLQTTAKWSFLDAVNENAGKIKEHAGNKSNPHGVTKAQIGLGNVSNTSDAGKPLSSAAKMENYYPEYSADEVDENTVLYFDIAEMSPMSKETIYKRRVRGISGSTHWYDLVSKSGIALIEQDYQADGIISNTTPRTLSYGTDYLCFDDKASFTIAFSAKFPHTAEKNDLFVFGNTGTMAIQQNGAYGIRLVTFDNNVNLCCYPNNADGYCVEPNSWNEYHHYAVVFDVENNTVTWYQDGVIADTAEMTNNEGSIRLQGGGNLTFFNNISGVDTDGSDNVFGLQYFKVVNKALTSEEVDAIYQKHSIIDYANDRTQYDNKFREINKELDEIGKELDKKQNEIKFYIDGNVNPWYVGDSLTQTNIMQMADGSIEVYQNEYDISPFTQYTHATTPTQIGTWVDGTPMWRVSFLPELMVSSTYCKHKEDGYIVYIDTNSLLQSQVTHLSDVTFFNTNNILVYSEVAEYNVQPVQGDGVVAKIYFSYGAESVYEDLITYGNGYWYGWIEFATPESNLK